MLVHPTASPSALAADLYVLSMQQQQQKTLKKHYFFNQNISDKVPKRL
jgi:hypothetical protein